MHDSPLPMPDASGRPGDCHSNDAQVRPADLVCAHGLEGLVRHHDDLEVSGRAVCLDERKETTTQYNWFHGLHTYLRHDESRWVAQKSWAHTLQKGIRVRSA